MASEQLRALAETHKIDDPALASCWEFVLEAAIVGWLNGLLLEEFIEAIKSGTGRGVEEFGIELDIAAPGEALVWFISDERTCGRDLLLGELEKLRDEREQVQSVATAEVERLARQRVAAKRTRRARWRWTPWSRSGRR